MNVLKNKEGVAIFATRFALVIEFFLLGRYVYDVIMKEIPVASMAIPGFFLCFVIGYLLFGFFADTYKSRGTLSGICLMFWGLLVLLIPFLSIDRTILLMPVAKINSHSLYLTYVMAGLGSLIGIFAGGFFRSFGAFTIAQDRNYPMYSGTAIIGALIVQALTPVLFSYEVVFYLAAVILFYAGISLDSSESLTPRSGSSQGATPMNIPISLAKGLLLASIAMVGAFLRDFLSLQLNYGEWSLLFVVGVPLVLSLITVPVLRNNGFSQGDLLAPLTSIYLGALLLTAFIPVGFITVLSLILAVSSVFSVGFTVQQAERSTLSLCIKIGSILGGYYLGGWIVTNFGELVQFTSKRFYYIPPQALFLGAALLALPVVIGLWVARPKRG